ncbi:Protein of unknown function [Lactobacillus delbrueckii subsp. bulgaricus]|nr:Protein of unknown function [Lactobacillus delbrueckii subsp. bulgaricus]
MVKNKNYWNKSAVKLT